MHGVAIKEPSAHARASSTSFEIKRQHVCRLDRARGSKAWTDGLATTSKTGEIMKPDRARYDDVRKILERAIDFYRRAAIGCSQEHHLRSIVSIVINCSYALRDEWRQQLDLFCRRDWTMNSGGEDDCQISG